MSISSSSASGPASRVFARPPRFDAIFLLLCGLSGALAGMMVSSPVFVIEILPSDTFISIDVATRAAAHQVPHVDFSTPLGDAYYALHRLAAMFCPPPRSVIVANVLVCGGLSAVLVALGRRRIDPPVLGLLVLFVASTLIAPTFSEAPPLITHMASYNRIGWGALAVALVGALREPSSPSPLADALLLAALIVGAALVKITFAPPLLFVVLVGGVLLPANRSACAGALVLASIVLVGFLTSTPAGAGYLKDLAATARSAPPGATGIRIPGLRPEKFASDLQAMWAVIGVVGLAAGASCLLDRGPRRAALVTLGLVASLLASNQVHDRVLVSAPVLCGIGLARPGGTDGSPSWRWACVALAALPQLLGNVLAIVRYWALANGVLPGVRVGLGVRDDIAFSHGDGGRLDPVLQGERAVTSLRDPTAPMVFGPAEYRAWVEDGVRATRLYGRPDGTVQELYWVTQAINIATGRPMPRHHLQWWDYGRSYNEHTRPAPDLVFADVSTVLWSKILPDYSTRADHEDHGHRCPEGRMVDLYGGFVTSHFVWAGQTALWDVWVRVDDPVPDAEPSAPGRAVPAPVFAR